MNKKIICIVGPTASGKTAVGIKLAKKFNGEIISADSRQIFKKLDIGTNKDLDKYGKIKYYLIDICDPGEKFTVFDWLKNAKTAIEDIFSRGKPPIVVGGTGLYVEALCEGYDISGRPAKLGVVGPKLKVKSEKKKYTGQELEKKSLKELQIIYRELEAGGRGLDTNNPRRLIRAIEKAQEGIKAGKNKPGFEILQIGISLPRSILYERIDKKVDEWLESGLVGEVGGLLKSGINLKWLKSIGLNYRLATEHILKKDPETLEELKQAIKFKTHALARRQLTWFRHHGNVKWVPSYKEAEKIAKCFLNAT